jgi:THO complex subunit 2
VSARWGLYGRWSTKYNEVPELQVRHTEVSRETKGILRRVTTSTAETKDNNYAKLSIPLAKLAHSNPLVVFGDCVKQAIVYDNLIDPITESARALTTMGYDVLTYILVTGFADESRPRMKSDGTSIANWLQSTTSLTHNL